MDDPFIPGISAAPSLPLERFLPLLPVGMVSSWIRPHLPKGSWLLDPIGNHPYQSIELANAGYRILVTANNPIHAFLLEILASKPSSSDFLSALDALAQAVIGENEKVESYINSYYRVPCAHCGKPLTVTHFVWHRDEETPFAYMGDCPSCGLSGEQILSLEAAQALRQVPTYSLHRARAIESVASISDPLRLEVETILGCYLKRPLALLQILTHKVASLNISDQHKLLLRALLLSVYDQANTMWAHPTARSRPRQVVIPTVFQEPNIWNALNAAVQVWNSPYMPVVIREWPDVPPLSGGISLFKGRARELSPEPPAGMIQAITTILPRPNQAFWALSTLWTGWLWGQDSASPLKNVLGRQRYDWNWHANALHVTFQGLHRLVREAVPLFMIISENEHEFLMAAAYAADLAGFKMETIALSGDGETAQLIWTNGLPSVDKIEEVNRSIAIRHAVKEYLLGRGEPASYQKIQSNIIKNLHMKQLLASYSESSSDITIYDIIKSINAVFMDINFLERYGGGPASVDTGLYWLKEEPPYRPSITDRTEKLVLDYMQMHQIAEYMDVRAAIYQECSGLYTPDDEVIIACLSAYAYPVAEEPNHWQIKKNEDPLSRERDVKELIRILGELAKELKYYHQSVGDKIEWLADNGENEYTFFIITDAIISRLIFATEESSTRKVILLPGSRANLLAHKLKRDPHLNAALAKGWQFAKFRQLRTIRENPFLTRELFHLQIREDPPEYEASQLMLF